MKNPAKKLAKASKKFEAWALTEAFPLWWKAGRHSNGAFYEALDFEGQPVPSDIARVRVQARQIFSLALAWKMGFRKKSLPVKLEQSMDRMLATCLVKEGLPGTLVDIEKGVLTDPQASLYVTAFMLLALAQSRKVLGSKAVDPKIETLLANIDQWLALPGGNGYREYLSSDSERLQNPHMHLYESFLLLYRTTGREDILERAETLLDFVRKTFFDAQNGVVREKVNPGVEMPPGPYEPGHSMEWVWLLGMRSRLLNEPLDPFAQRLYEHYYSAGIAEGRAPMGLTVNNEPFDASCRLWSQTESLKAHLTMAESGPPELAATALHRAVECAQDIHDRWLATDCRGGWYDHFDGDGELIAKDIPGSMCYHLYVMVKELKRASKKLKNRRLDELPARAQGR